jgi:hypothetical protein
MLNKGWTNMGGSKRFNGAGSYRPWGQVRRRNFMARLKYTLMMTLLGLVSIAFISIMAVFAASVLLIGAGICLLAAFTTFVLRRVPVKVRSKSEPAPKANGVFTARKVGNTWITY